MYAYIHPCFNIRPLKYRKLSRTLKNADFLDVLILSLSRYLESAYWGMYHCNKNLKIRLYKTQLLFISALDCCNVVFNIVRNEAVLKL